MDLTASDGEDEEKEEVPTDVMIQVLRLQLKESEDTVEQCIATVTDLKHEKLVLQVRLWGISDRMRGERARWNQATREIIGVAVGKAEQVYGDLGVKPEDTTAERLEMLQWNSMPKEFAAAGDTLDELIDGLAAVREVLVRNPAGALTGQFERDLQDVI